MNDKRIIKVCGMREAENIRAVEALGVDWIGMIFWERSKRFVAQHPTYLPTKAQRVGVFVDADTEVIRRTADDYQLDFIQLHGHEGVEDIRKLRGLHIIKAISIGCAEDLNAVHKYEGEVDYFLFDTKCKTVGGSGEHFDWMVLQAYRGKTPFLLSGGIGPDDRQRVADFHHEQCVGIDLNSRFETAPGLKDIQKLKDFIL